MEVEKPLVIVTLLTGDGETILYPKSLQTVEDSMAWSNFQKWIADFLEKHYKEVATFEIDDEWAVIVYELK